MTAKFEGEKESVLADSRAGLGEMRKEWQSIPAASQSSGLAWEKRARLGELGGGWV